MRRLIPLLLLIPAALHADCKVGDVLMTLRPGAEWTMTGNDTSTLVWSSTQTIPTKAEVIQAIQDCRTAAQARLTAKQQARLDVRDTSLTANQRFQALLILLDFDQ